MVSTDAILFYVISLLNSGDSSLRFGMTRRDCGRVGERSGDSLKHIEEDQNRVSNRHFFPPLSKIINCHSERQRGISHTFNHLSSVIKVENHESAEK